jgi:hypothetical protein
MSMDNVTTGRRVSIINTGHLEPGKYALRLEFCNAEGRKLYR